MLEFRWRQGWNGPHLHLRPAAADELFAIFGNEFMKHARTPAFLTSYDADRVHTGPRTPLNRVGHDSALGFEATPAET